MTRLLPALLLLACRSEKGEVDDTGRADGGGGAAEVLLGALAEGGCDPLVPEHCGLPFPSNAYLVEDASTASGRRVAFPEDVMPEASNGFRSSPELLNAADGFSPGAGPMTFLPGATGEGLVSPFSPEDSLLDGSLTVILDAETGERVPHFAELDMSHEDEERRALLLRPVVRLEDSRRYIVAIRGVQDADGLAVEPSAAFRALRDGGESDEPSVEARRALYEDIFERLERAGLSRAELQIAWDFSTASRESNTGRLLHMRDQSLAALPESGPTYTITSVEAAPYERVALRIEGTITAPLYLDDGAPGGVMQLDEDGVPQQNGTYEYPFLLIIPDSCAEAPCALIQYGHGLFGSRYDLESSTYVAMLDDFGGAGFALDLIGMSGEDLGTLAGVALSGDLARFAATPDRSQQNFLNMILAMRAMMGPMVEDPSTFLDGAATLDPERRYYFGGSQGGIYGATYMAVSPDIERGVLGVPGASYSLMLPRSEYWGIYATPFLVEVFEDPRDVMLALGYVQMLWDRAEPTGYAPYITEDTLPDTPSHRVLLLEAIGDHQVPNLATELLARSVGAVHLEPRNHEHLGLPGVEGPVEEGNVLVDYDFGLPSVPEENVPMEIGDDPHNRIADLPVAQSIAATFLATGSVIQTCDGACDPD